MLCWEYPPRVIGGLARHAEGLARALTGLGHDVTVVTAGADAPALEQAAGVHVRRAMGGHPHARDFLDWVKHLNHELLEAILAEVAGGKRFDLVHAHDWMVAPAAKAAKHALRIPLVATIHATEFGRNGGLYTPEQRHIGDLEWWLTYEAWRVICCSQYMRGEITGFYQVPGDKLRVIPNGVWPDEFQAGAPAGERAAAFRARYAAPEQRLLFFVGRLVREKGVDVLLHAMQIAQGGGDNWKLVVGGRGPAYDSLRELAERLGTAAHVYFTGFIDDATRNALYSVADAAVFPSTYEPFGIVALEAMAAGAPLVCTTAGGLTEFVENERNGLLAAPGDAWTLHQALRRVCDEPGLGARLAAQGRADVAAKYRWPVVAETTAALYQEVLDDHRQSGWARPAALAH